MEKNRRLFSSRIKQNLVGKYIAVNDISDSETEFLVWKNQLPEICQYLVNALKVQAKDAVYCRANWRGLCARWHVACR